MRIAISLLLLALVAAPLFAEEAAPLLTGAETHALAQEISGEVAKRNLEQIARHHRMRASDGFRAAADAIATELRRYGLDEVELLRFPADGAIFYGTQRSRPSWNVELAELWELREGGDLRMASWDEMPMRLAQDSESAEVMAAELVDVGTGTAESDYAGKDVRGKIVLAGAQPGLVAPLAVAKHGAAGILSYAQNQRTAWWGEDENLVRWGHLDTFAGTPTFAFMLSLKEARALRQRLAAGESVRLRASVRAAKAAGHYEVLTAVIRGTSADEIVYSCHLDHPRPGANDNASGCAAILEVARTLSKLIGEGKLRRPARSIRFVWPPEIEGTMALLTGRPDLTARMKAAIHLDMVGGGPETKAIFHVTRGPASLPSFIYDLGQEIGRWVNEQTARFAMTGSAPYPLNAPTGGKEALQAAFPDLTIGSDHQIYSEGSFRVPAIYLNDWPDRYIHTTGDQAANIDPTKMQRAAFIAAASGWVLASFGPDEVAPMISILRRGALRRAAESHRAPFSAEYERRLVDSIGAFAAPSDAERRAAATFLSSLERLSGGGPRPAAPAQRGEGAIVYRRNPQLPGPMSVFGYDYLEAHYGAERAAGLELLRIIGGRRGSGADYAYEALNLVDGMRTVGKIRDRLSAVYGAVPLGAVAEYLRALEEIGVVRR
ncbi:MAG TPA: M28 family metallopeptidase [Thermoanaerobaculia bacterium]|nr:M28 family metallopeptidase [Thermoanaerobaculia bacterium]